MARTKKTSQTAEVIGSTLEDTTKTENDNGMIAIACSLPFGLKFDDIPAGNGATKTIVFPGVNSDLKGKTSGVLALPGNAICVNLPKSDWEAILAIHGKEVAFTGKNGRMPCIYPVGDKRGFKSAASEIAQMRHGLEPIDPSAVGVETTKQ
jgi:hypothetical protein